MMDTEIFLYTKTSLDHMVLCMYTEIILYNVPISDEIAEILEKVADKATDFDSFKTELLRLSSEWTPDKIAELMAIAFFSARAKGDNNFAG